MDSKKLFPVVAGFLLSLQLVAQVSPESSDNGINRPKLVVGLVVDQMRWDYLYRYAALYGSGGFKKLLKKGYQFSETYIPYATTVTAAGHASLYTGSVPSIHGIVANEWVEKSIGDTMYCTSDSRVRSIGTSSVQGKMSPSNMRVTTIGDELRLATQFRSRVFGIALKDRGGILAAGHNASASYWFDDSTGNWISSSYYMERLPDWVEQINQSRRVDSFMMQDWNPLMDTKLYVQSTADSSVYERPLYHESSTRFPHRYRSLIGKNYYPFRQSPYGNSFSFYFAEALIREEQLGRRGETDMLCLSLSSTDYIGHRFGPNSLEMEDTYLRLDRDLEEFLNYLDTCVGENNYLLFITADHGAPQSPGFMKANRMPGGSLSKYTLRDNLNAYLFKRFQAQGLVKVIYDFQVYIDQEKAVRLKIPQASIEQAILDYLIMLPQVQYAFAYSGFSQAILSNAWREKFALGYDAKRSGEIQYIPPSQFTDILQSGTEHGSLYPYDTHIPLLWYGWNIQAGTSYRAVQMTDVAPTISAMLKIQVPGGSVGRVLTELLEEKKVNASD